MGRYSKKTLETIKVPMLNKCSSCKTSCGAVCNGRCISLCTSQSDINYI